MTKKNITKRIIQIALLTIMIVIILLLLKSCEKDENYQDKYEIIGNYTMSYGDVLDRKKIKVICNGKEIPSTIDDSNVNYGKIGTYTIIIIYKDENGKEQKIEKKIEIVDDEAPIILLNGSKNIKVEENSEYTELGYKVSDNYDHEEDIKVNIQGDVDISKLGTYVITYFAEDQSGNKSEITRTVIVEEKKLGVTTLQLKGLSTVYLDYPNDYIEHGATAIDSLEGDISKNIKISSNVNTMLLGTYEVTYEITNSDNVTTKTIRTIIVKDTEKPTLTLKGDSVITVEVKSPYIEPGATVTDNYDTNLTYSVYGLIDTNTIGEYTLTYQVEDSSSNMVSVNRIVKVRDTKKPTLVLKGDSVITVEVKSPYIEPGATVTDNYDTNLTYTIDGQVDNNTIGEYTLTYRAEDSSSNITTATRIIKVIETTYSVIFNSNGGSAVSLMILVKGTSVTNPTAPTRAGYTFSHWYEDGTSDSIPYDFTNSKIEKDTILIAKWSPLMVNYKIAIWMEKANFKGTPTPGNIEDYDYITAVTATGRAAEMTEINIDSLPSNIQTLFTDKTSVLKYSKPQSVEKKVIHGNETTVINLYAARKEYTYELNLGTSATNKMTINATTFTGGNTSVPRYSFKVKYEMDIYHIFPLQGLDFVSFTSNFNSWTRPTIAQWKDTSAIASLRKTVDEGMLSEDGQTSSYTFTATWTATGTAIPYRYFVQALPGEKHDIERDGIGYVLMDEFNQSIKSSTLAAKTINGLTAISSTPYRYNYNNVVYTSNTAGTYYCFFYNRNNYTLAFNLKAPDGETVVPIPNSDISFGTPLITYKPNNPYTLSGKYQFAGWYLDADYMVKANFDTMTMPYKNIILYAKWQSNEITVTFLDSKNGEIVGSQETNQGGYVLDNTYTYLNLDSGGYANGKGKFIGWYYDVMGYPLAWLFDNKIYTNYTLYAVWETSG